MSTQTAPAGSGHTKAINLQAARAQGRLGSDFGIKPRDAAEDVILDQSVICVDRGTYDAFVASLDVPNDRTSGCAKSMAIRLTSENVRPNMGKRL